MCPKTNGGNLGRCPGRLSATCPGTCSLLCWPTAQAANGKDDSSKESRPRLKTLDFGDSQTVNGQVSMLFEAELATTKSLVLQCGCRRECVNSCSINSAGSRSVRTRLAGSKPSASTNYTRRFNCAPPLAQRSLDSDRYRPTTIPCVCVSIYVQHDLLK